MNLHFDGDFVEVSFVAKGEGECLICCGYYEGALPHNCIPTDLDVWVGNTLTPPILPQPKERYASTHTI